MRSPEPHLRKLQDHFRNAGWRIQHIPWQPDNKLEWIRPRDPFSAILAILGFGSFLGGIPLTSHFLEWGIATMLTGLLMLFSSVWVMGYFWYRRFVKIRAKCLDYEIREFEESDSDGKRTRRMIWFGRFLFEFDFENRNYRVTPVFYPQKTFREEQQILTYLQNILDAEGCTTVWINPENPLESVFPHLPRTVRTA